MEATITKPNWPIGVALAAIHLIALLAFLPQFFSWSGVAVACALWYITGGLGVTLGFHRLLTHRSLEVPKPLEYLLTFLGTLSLQGGPLEWVSTHRKHHAFTDKDGDPHDANRGFWWTHVGWLYASNKSFPRRVEQERYAPDLFADAGYRWMDKYHAALQVALGLALYFVGGWSWVIWGIFVRLVVVYNITWFVNSATHKFGYRNFKTNDLSTNCWWVGLLAWGEGWHNNHHAFPFSARHGMRWFEFDLTWLTIRLLSALKIARDVKLPNVQMLERRTLRSQKAAS